MQAKAAGKPGAKKAPPKGDKPAAAAGDKPAAKAAKKEKAPAVEDKNDSRQFNLYFPDEDIQGKRAFSCNEGSHPSTLEPFLIDERKVTLDLLIYGLVQRLNGQKWLQLN